MATNSLRDSKYLRMQQDQMTSEADTASSNEHEATSEYEDGQLAWANNLIELARLSFVGASEIEVSQLQKGLNEFITLLRPLATDGEVSSYSSAAPTILQAISPG